MGGPVAGSGVIVAAPIATRDDPAMKVSHYFEFEDHVTGGIHESVVHQRKMLDREGIEYTTEATLDADVLHCNLMGPRSVWYAKRASDRGIPVVAHTHVTAEDFGDSFRFTNALAKPLKPLLEPGVSTRRRAGLSLRVQPRRDRGVHRHSDDRHLERRRPREARRLRVAGGRVPRALRSVPADRLPRRARDQAEGVGDVRRPRPRTTPTSTSRGSAARPLLKRPRDHPAHRGVARELHVHRVRRRHSGAFAAGDVFLFPTHEENEGIALLEAMTAGKAVVVRDIETFSSTSTRTA